MARTGLERMGSPWRMRYIRTAGAQTGCLFCKVHRSRDDRRQQVLARRPGALLMLNRYPYNPAHLMVAVKRHVAHFGELTNEERTDMMDLTGLAERALENEYAPHGLNYGVNVGRVAGAGFPGHLHLHIVPRWDGDTNFMTTTAETRVLPESLGATWTRLRRAIRTIEGASSPGRAKPATPRGKKTPAGRSVGNVRKASRAVRQPAKRARPVVR